MLNIESATSPVIALYNIDLDSTHSGAVCASSHTANFNATQVDLAILVNATTLVQTYVNSSFTATSVIIYTLSNVPVYDNPGYSVTAQLVLAFNQYSTYAIYLYPNGGINMATTLAISIGAQLANKPFIATYTASQTSNAVLRMDDLTNLSTSRLHILIRSCANQI